MNVGGKKHIRKQDWIRIITVRRTKFKRPILSDARNISFDSSYIGALLSNCVVAPP